MSRKTRQQRRIDPAIKTMLEDAEAEVERAAEVITAYSRQPRFSEPQPAPLSWWSSWARMVDDMNLEEPTWGVANLRARGEWLRAFWPREPHLAGVVNSVVNIDKNRGWTLVGGRNTVAIYSSILHQAEGVGWRRYCQKAALAYCTNDFGGVTELGRDGEKGPLRGIYNVDPCRCKPTGTPETPLAYTPPGGTMQLWRALDFFRVVALESTDETALGLGVCALSRALDLAKVMVGVYRYSLEKLGAVMPHGLLLLSGVDEYQWRQAMEARQEQLAERERQYYGGVAVLANSTATVDAKLVALSQLPDTFDLRTWTDLLMYGLALCFGYDPREVWPVSSGALGTATETESQHVKATAKGAADFTLQLQEALNQPWVLPPTVHFEFDERDDAGKLQAAQVAEAQSRVVVNLYNAGLQQGAPLLSRDEARQLLVENGIIPAAWTEQEESATADDEQNERMWRERLLAIPSVRRQIEAFPTEPVLAYRWTPFHQRWAEVWRPRSQWRSAVLRQRDPVTRPDEARFLAAVTGVLGDYMDDVAEDIVAGREPDTQEHDRALLVALIAALGALATETIINAGLDVGVEIDPGEAAALAAEWARGYAYDQVRGINATTRTLLQNIIAQYQLDPQMSLGNVKALLEPVFGPVRASAIAVTETTRAYAAGIGLYQRILRERYGVEVLRYWYTAEDERVCTAICLPLHGKPETVWAGEFPDGPPAHPNCRCTLSLEVKR